MFDFDLSDHVLTTISAWTEVGILLFMLWEKYGPQRDAGPMTKSQPPRQEGFWSKNRTLILAIFGLAIVAFLHLRSESKFPNGSATSIGLLLILGATVGAVFGAMLLRWYLRKQTKGRRVSTDQMRILIREFTNAKSKIPRVLFTHFNDHQGEALQYTHDLIEAVRRAGILASESGHQTPTDQSQDGIVLFAEHPSPISTKISNALTAAGIDHEIEEFHPGQTEFKIFVGPKPL